MKKILFASFMMLALGVMGYAQASPTKTTQKKEAVKPGSAVSSVTPATNKATVKAPAGEKAKPASPTTFTQTASSNAIRKPKKSHKAPKKPKK